MISFLLFAALATGSPCAVREASMILPKPKRPDCVEFGRRKTIDGVWFDQFEGTSFHRGARTLLDVRPSAGNVWLSLQPAARVRLPRGEGSGHAYRIRFIGRLAKDMHRNRGDGYGHFSMSSGLVLVDRIIEIEDLGCVAEFRGHPACLNPPIIP